MWLGGGVLFFLAAVVIGLILDGIGGGLSRIFGVRIHSVVPYEALSRDPIVRALQLYNLGRITQEEAIAMIRTYDKENNQS